MIIIYTRKKLKKMTHLSNTFNFSWKHKSFFTLFLYPLFATVFNQCTSEKRRICRYCEQANSSTGCCPSIKHNSLFLFVCLFLSYTHTQSKRFLQFAHWLIHSEEVWYSVCTFVDVIAMAWPACHLMSLLMCNNTKKTIKLRVELHILQLPLNFTVSCFKGKFKCCPLT